MDKLTLTDEMDGWLREADHLYMPERIVKFRREFLLPIEDAKVLLRIFVGRVFNEEDAGDYEELK